jgi:hypothetical protein
MKMSGTSLMPARMPVAAPFHHRRSGWHKSQTMMAIWTSSTWPRYKVRWTGSSQNATPTTSKVAPVLAMPRQPSSRNAMLAVTASAAVDTTAATSIRARNGTGVISAKTSAAKGVYVNWMPGCCCQVYRRAGSCRASTPPIR